MAENDKKISELSPLDTVTGDEMVPFAKNGANGMLRIDALDDRYIQASKEDLSPNDGGPNKTTLLYRRVRETDTDNGGVVGIYYRACRPVGESRPLIPGTNRLTAPAQYIQFAIYDADDDPGRGFFWIAPNGLFFGHHNSSNYMVPVICANNFAYGDYSGVIKVEYTESAGHYAVKLDGEKRAYVEVPEATAEAPGLMSATDKARIDALGQSAAIVPVTADEYAAMRDAGTLDEKTLYAIKG